MRQPTVQADPLAKLSTLVSLRVKFEYCNSTKLCLNWLCQARPFICLLLENS